MIRLANDREIIQTPLLILGVLIGAPVVSSRIRLGDPETLVRGAGILVRITPWIHPSVCFFFFSLLCLLSRGPVVSTADDGDRALVLSTGVAFVFSHRLVLVSSSRSLACLSRLAWTLDLQLIEFSRRFWTSGLRC